VYTTNDKQIDMTLSEIKYKNTRMEDGWLTRTRSWRNIVIIYRIEVNREFAWMDTADSAFRPYCQQ
jgi:hypothetical protein